MNVLQVVELCGTDISSRSRAAWLRRQVLSLPQSGSRIELNFAGVRTISDSFADELLGVLASERGDQWFRDNVIVSNLEKFPRETVLEAIGNRLQTA